MLRSLIIFFVLNQICSIANCQLNTSFVFGSESEKDGVISLKQAVSFSENSTYGFDIENQHKVAIVSSKPIGFCTSPEPFYFSVKVPEGVYDVAVTFGNPDTESTSTIKAEARRLMVFNKKTNAGASKTLHFTVSVRSPKIDSTRSINLKEREVNYMNWDDRLTLEFSGKNVAIQAITIQSKPHYKTIFLAGNSTVTDQDCAPWASWGQLITNYFHSDIVIANYAESGATMSSFKARGRLDKVLSQMKAGDYLFIEFGHNDMKEHGEGIGPWESFTNLLMEFISKSREKGGIPVLVTPTQRRTFNHAGLIEYTHGDYPAAMREVAEDFKVPLIDLNEMTKKVYEAWGAEESRKAFVQYPANTFPGQDQKLEDNTHFNTFGANEVAQCVLKGISEKLPDLKTYVVNFNWMYDPAMPNAFDNWNLVMSPRFVSKKPEGN